MNIINSYLPAFVVAALICGGLTFYVKRLAEKFELTDLPSPRKIHTKPIPRLGGLAIILTVIGLVLAYSFASTRLSFTSFHIWVFDKRLLGALSGTGILLLIGIIDDVRGMRPWQKLIGHLLAAGMVVVFGLGIDYIRFFGGHIIYLNSWVIPFALFGYHYTFVVWGDLLTIFWIVLLINTVNFLDGLDGLAAGVSFIAGISLFFLSLSLNQPAAALLAIIFSGSLLGFLPWNFNPARIFMGDSGSMFLGYMLGILSIISGGKIATAFLILGLPLLDVVWVVFRRIFHGDSPFSADKLHLHHRLLKIGLTQRQAVLVLYLIAAAFGVVAVVAGISGTQIKIEAFVGLLVLMAVLVLMLIVLEYRRRARNVE